MDCTDCELSGDGTPCGLCEEKYFYVTSKKHPLGLAVVTSQITEIMDLTKDLDERLAEIIGKLEAVKSKLDTVIEKHYEKIK